MRRLLRSVLGAALLTFPVMAEDAGPSVSFSGYLDADVWTDFTGKFYTNSELDLGLTTKFSDAVSAHVYATVNSGWIPAGYAAPQDRWLSFTFDGVDIEFTTGVGTFTVGDLVYQFGKFNYYYYKRQSMITKESFTRGLKYSLESGSFTQSVLAGVADIDSSTGDLVGVSGYSLGESQKIEAYYGLRGSVMSGFETGTSVFAGAEYTGGFGDMLTIKANVGFTNHGVVDRPSDFRILVEPTLTLGGFSLAASFFAYVDPDSALASPVDDKLLAYIEPGYSFTDMFAVGLPIEYHEPASGDDPAIWLVPTFYVYPAEKVQWWIWGQTVIPTKGGDLGWGLGSELIVEF